MTMEADDQTRKLLEEIREAQASGEVTTQEEAIALARRRVEGTAAPAS